jgi:dipeptidyl aminopeptidase/acylaminoacyl peptidase
MNAGAFVLDPTVPDPVPRPVGPQDGYVEHAGWTADGRSLLTVTPVGSPSRQAHLFRLSMDGREHRDLTGSLDRNVLPGGPAYPGGLPQAVGGETVLFCARDRGDTHLYAVDASTGTIRPVLAEPGTTVAGLSVGRDGHTAVVVLSAPDSYGEVASVDLGTEEVTVHTRHGSALADVELLTPTECEFKISDGTVVHGWLLRDPEAHGPRPLLLDVHGGPHNAWSAAANGECHYHQVLAARGWAVLLLNPRGSDGYGSDFFSASFGAWGTSDARDLLEPIDQLVAEGTADPSRLAVAGYSYGGYMSCYLTSRDSRFAAAVTGGVISDLTSMAGTSDAGHLLAAHELGVHPWADPERFAEMSPLAQVARVRTPTLILQGAADTRCPLGQAQQWHTSLRERGVPSRLVLYPGGSHLFPIDGPPSHRLDYNSRIVAWLEAHTRVGLRDG